MKKSEIMEIVESADSTEAMLDKGISLQHFWQDIKGTEDFLNLNLSFCEISPMKSYRIESREYAGVMAEIYADIEDYSRVCAEIIVNRMKSGRGDVDIFREEKVDWLIPLGEWAEAHGIGSATARQRAERGAFKTARKIGRNWVISRNEELVDHRRKEA